MTVKLNYGGAEDGFETYFRFTVTGVHGESRRDMCAALSDWADGRGRVVIRSDDGEEIMLPPDGFCFTVTDDGITVWASGHKHTAVFASMFLSWLFSRIEKHEGKRKTVPLLATFVHPKTKETYARIMFITPEGVEEYEVCPRELPAVG